MKWKLKREIFLFNKILPIQISSCKNTSVQSTWKTEYLEYKISENFTILAKKLKSQTFVVSCIQTEIHICAHKVVLVHTYFNFGFLSQFSRRAKKKRSSKLLHDHCNMTTKKNFFSKILKISLLKQTNFFWLMYVLCQMISHVSLHLYK